MTQKQKISIVLLLDLCIQILQNNGQNMVSSNTPIISLTSEQKKYLKYCMYYGFHATNTSEPSESQKNKYIATQAMVWIIEKEVFNTSAANSAAKKLCASAPSSSESYNYYLVLKEKMLTALEVKRSSFSVSAKTNAETFELKWSKENSRYQEFISTVPDNESFFAYLKLKTNPIGYGEIVKKDSSTGKVLGGAVYGIYKDKGCTSLVEKLTTDQKGYAKSSYNDYKIYLACGKTDMRKSMDGLCGIVQNHFQLDPREKAMFAFCNQRRNRIKLLVWEDNGFWVHFKRLEKGSIDWPEPSSEEATMNLTVERGRDTRGIHSNGTRRKNTGASPHQAQGKERFQA